MLFLVATLCFVISGALHNVFHAVADNFESMQVLPEILTGLSVTFFLVAVLICPPAVMIGLVGSIAMLIRKHHRPRHACPPYLP